MAMFIALYSVALALSIGFFLWSVYSFYSSKRAATKKRKLDIQMGPESEPLIVALYCQYLVAPQRALSEAQQALLAATAGRRTVAEVEAVNDFFEVLDLLELRTTATLRGS